MVSIIIPVYNVEKYIDRCLESVVNQTYRDIEILIMEAKSIDNSLQRAIEWSGKDDRITIVSRKDGGLGPGRNFGVGIAKGEYVFFLDSDDWLDSDYIEKIVMAAMQDTAIDIVVTDYIEHYEQSGDIYYVRNNWTDGIYGNSAEEKNKFISYGSHSVWGKLYRKSLLVDNAILQPALPFEDLAVYAAVIASAGKIAVCNRVPYHYQAQREGSLMGNSKAYLKFPQVMEWSENALRKSGKYGIYEKSWKFAMYRQFRKICGFASEIKLPESLSHMRRLEKLTYWAVGSFNLRWIVHRLEHGKDGLTKHFVFTSLIAQMSKGESNCQATHRNAFRQGCIESDIRGEMASLLEIQEKKPDFILIDLLQECQDILKTETGNYITDSEALRESDFNAKAYKRISWRADADFWDIWKQKCTQFIDRLKNIFFPEQVMLVENYYADSYLEEGILKKYDRKTILEGIEENEMLKKMYGYFQENYEGIKIFKVPEEVLYTDVQGYHNHPVYMNALAYGIVSAQIGMEIYSF